jgi:hypothetical protein
MKKLLLIFPIFILFISSVSADFFDDWSDDNLCGWSDNPSTPDYIVDETKKREIKCENGKSIKQEEKKTEKKEKKEK